MPSRFLDADLAKRHSEHRYDFNRRGLAGRVVLLPGGAAAWAPPSPPCSCRTARCPSSAYRSNRGRALAFQQKLQDLYGGPVAPGRGRHRRRTRAARAPGGRPRPKGELYGLVALTGDPARVKPEELDGGGPARVVRGQLRGAGAAGPRLRRAHGRARARRAPSCSSPACRASIPSRAAWPTRAQGRAGARRAHPGQGVRRRRRHPRQRGGARGHHRRHGPRLHRLRQIRPLRGARRHPALRPARRTWPGWCACCWSPTPTSRGR